ncbi:ISKra4 family transposase [PVC group bacterium]|nr:ISKra4 family transposase [PVC group bacterium]
MACVGAAYTIEPFPRTPEDLLDELFHREREQTRPRPQFKRVCAELTPEGGPSPVRNGKDSLFGWLADELALRGVIPRKTLICLMDGERALWRIAKHYFPDEIIYILDFYHVLEKLWKAAHCFHTEGSEEAEAFVKHRVEMLLEGKVSYVVAGLRQMATKRGLRGNKRKTITEVTNYFWRNRTRMKYDEYLAAGYPIGSGAVEGACRHLVKDRMERTGMHWRVAGAQAMLSLRALYLNGDWDDFCDFRNRQESERIYPYRETITQIHWPLAA